MARFGQNQWRRNEMSTYDENELLVMVAELMKSDKSSDKALACVLKSAAKEITYLKQSLVDKNDELKMAMLVISTYAEAYPNDKYAANWLKSHKKGNMK
jgi:propanediol dehydratase large subunit